MKTYKYHSTFISGSKEIIKEISKKEIPDIQIDFISQDLLIYSTKLTPERIKVLPFFNNSFLHIKQFGDQSMKSVDKQLTWAIERPTFLQTIRQFDFHKGDKFRVVCAKNNQTISVDKDLLTKVEELITYSTGLKVHKTKPDIEFWFNEKRENYGICGIRITKKPDYQENSEKGELRSELAYIMNYLSQPQKNDIYLDPFCGSGALGINRAKYFPYKLIINSDIDLSRIKRKLSKEKANFKNFKVVESNFLKIQETRITKIVTDPPWGDHDNLNVNELYKDMLIKMKEVTSDNAVIVILTSQEVLFESLLKKYKIWVGGKDAFLYCFQFLNTRTGSPRHSGKYKTQ